MLAKVSHADRSVGEVSGLGRTLPNPHLLAMSLLRTEAVLSSRIEGAQATLSDLALFEASASEAGVGDVREVAYYVRAANHVLDPQRRLPMSLPLLLEAHRLLMTGVRGDRATPGEFRRSQNWIGPSGVLISEATMVRATRLQALREAYRARVTSPRGSALQHALVDQLFATPAITIGNATELLGVTRRAATGNIDKLIAADILTEVSRRGKTRFFVAEELLRLMMSGSD